MFLTQHDLEEYSTNIYKYIYIYVFFFLNRKIQYGSPVKEKPLRMLNMLGQSLTSLIQDSQLISSHMRIMRDILVLLWLYSSRNQKVSLIIINCLYIFFFFFTYVLFSSSSFATSRLSLNSLKFA